jgi:hypothetical protein
MRPGVEPSPRWTRYSNASPTKVPIVRVSGRRAARLQRDALGRLGQLRIEAVRGVSVGLDGGADGRRDAFEHVVGQRARPGVRQPGLAGILVEHFDGAAIGARQRVEVRLAGRGGGGVVPEQVHRHVGRLVRDFLDRVGRRDGLLRERQPDGRRLLQRLAEDLGPFVARHHRQAAREPHAVATPVRRADLAGCGDADHRPDHLAQERVPQRLHAPVFLTVARVDPMNEDERHRHLRAAAIPGRHGRGRVGGHESSSRGRGRTSSSLSMRRPGQRPFAKRVGATLPAGLAPHIRSTPW